MTLQAMMSLHDVSGHVRMTVMTLMLCLKVSWIQWLPSQKHLLPTKMREKDVAFNIKQETRGRSERNGAESEGKLSEG